MVINGKHLLALQPILEMEPSKKQVHGTSYGLAEAGYDIRIKQSVLFHPHGYPEWSDGPCVATKWREEDGSQRGEFRHGRFALASAIEEFRMPNNLVGIVHDKSTWARKGLSVFNTVIEPGWNGFLTLELVYHGNDTLTIPAGSGIAQVLFHELQSPGAYEGKYQNQKDEPVHAKFNPQ